MRRVVSSTLAAETQSLLNGLVRAEWIAAHFAKALSQATLSSPMNRVCQVVATWFSLSSPSSVDDKRCGFDLVISRQCMQRLGATIRWAPTNRQFADALTKDVPDPVDLLRSCMRSGEYQLSPEHIIQERAAAERSRRKQRQVSSQSSSLRSEPSVSSIAFLAEQRVCFKRSEPANTVCVMVVFPSLGSGLQMRSFLESLDSEYASSATSVKVKVPAVLIDAISFEESAATLTLTWSKNTRKVQVQGPLAMLDRAKEQLVKLLQAYRTYCASRKVLPPPKGGERAASMLRCPAKSDYLVSLEEGSESNRKRATFVPQDPAFGAIVEQITAGGTGLLDRWPGRQTKFAEFMVHEFGACENILEDLDLKAAPNCNGRFSKVDVTAENATLPDETPVLQLQPQCASLKDSYPVLMVTNMPLS